MQTFYRLFMAPGMAHCGGGTGPNTFDMQAALEQWVERGIAPGAGRRYARWSTASWIASVRSVRTRRCATYNGKGDTNDAANFVCR